MRLQVLSIAAMLPIAGCTTMSPEEQEAADEAECRTYGFVKRNDAFAGCLQRLELDRRAARRASRAEIYHDPFPRTRVTVEPAAPSAG